MASGSIISIVNRALGSIGSRSQIQSMSEGSAESNAANVFFVPTYQSLARTSHWGCLKKQAPLTLLLSAPGTTSNPNGTITPYPPNPWLYTYLLPPDSLYIRRLVPPPILPVAGSPPIYPQGINTFWGYGSNCIIPYETGYGQDTNKNNVEVINTNLAAAECIYTVNEPNPIFWDSSFQSAMVASLAAYLVPALSLDKSLMQMQIKIASGLIAEAKARDGNESPTSQYREAPWIEARQGSGRWNVGFNGPRLNYEMSWPC